MGLSYRSPDLGLFLLNANKTEISISYLPDGEYHREIIHYFEMIGKRKYRVELLILKYYRFKSRDLNHKSATLAHRYQLEIS